MTELNRLRWRARRGMLELDILLLDFLEQHYPVLPPRLQNAFGELLELGDSELWDMIQTDQSVAQPEQAIIIEWLRTGKYNESSD